MSFWGEPTRKWLKTNWLHLGSEKITLGSGATLTIERWFDEFDDYPDFDEPAAKLKIESVDWLRTAGE